MILQSLPNCSLIYVDDYRTNYKDVLQKFNMLNADGSVKQHVRLSQETYKNSNGVIMPAYHIVGHTVDMYVVDKTRSMDINTASDIAEGLNYFPNCQYKFRQYGFSGKFRSDTPGTLYDYVGRGITITDYLVKDMSGIYDLMCHLDLNNGKLFEPVIARYVYASRQIRRKKLQIVGYFNLSDYLHAIKHDAANLFSRAGKTSSDLYFKLGSNRKLNFTIISSTNGVANVDITGMEQILDVKRTNAFQPYVIVNLAPLRIATMKFPWAKVVFEKTPVFLTPMMTGPEAWGTLQGGVDLLAKTII